MNLNSFKPKEYWENRLEKNYSLQGVGFKGLGKWYNYWTYRVKSHVFKRIVRSLGLDVKKVSVLDIGSGTGFYIDRWEAAGAKEISGLDFTQIAVSKLRKKYSSHVFFEADIGGNLKIGCKKFDIISAFDILFHIVDDKRFEKAIENINSLLDSGGRLLFSDIFLHSETLRDKHLVWRNLEYIENKLIENGFEITDRVPMFFFMNVPVDSSNLILKWYWRIVAGLVSCFEIVGFIFGALSYPVELFYVNIFRESPTIELMICKKI